MIYKITLVLFGVDFFPDSILHLIKGEFEVASKNNPQDKKNPKDNYGFGSISIFHPKKFATQSNLQNYEEWFINLLINNNDLFISRGVQEYEFFIEVYSEDEQCNFEIFNKELLRKINHINISFPVSTYRLKTDYYRQWVNEIDEIWQK